MATGIPVYYAIKVIGVDGSTVLNPLPFVGCQFEVIYPQPGMPGASTIGPFTVTLYSPTSNKWKWAKPQYDLLTQMMRLEFYQVAAPNDAPVSGTPRFTGVITQIHKDKTSMSLSGMDSLFVLGTQRTRRTEALSGTSTDTVVKAALKGYSLTFGDDFTSAGLAANYTNNGTWTYTTNEGFPALAAGAGGDGLLYTTGSYTNAQYADMVVRAHYSVVCDTAAGAGAECGIIAAVTDSSNMVMGRANVTRVTSTAFAVSSEIWQKAAGSWALKAAVNNGVSLSTGLFRGQIELIGIQQDSTHYIWYLLINEFDVNCNWIQTVTAGNPTGAIGLRSAKAGSYSAAVAYAEKQLIFGSKVNLFQNGTISAGSQLITQPISLTTRLDLLNLAQTTENWGIRKTAKAGLNNDTIDFMATPGTDLTASVELNDSNLQQVTQEPNAEKLDTVLAVAASPGPDGSGIMHWATVAGINKYGWVEDVLSIPTLVGTLSTRQAADQVLKNRSTPDQAKRLQIIRTADLIEAPGTNNPTGLKFREGDKVTVHQPQMGFNHQSALVYTATMTHGSPVIECALDQYPTHLQRSPGRDRLIQTVEHLALRSADVTPALSGNIYDRRILLPINPYKMRATLSGNQTITTLVGTTLINFDTVTYDTSNSFNATNHQWVVPVAGYYFVSASLDMTVPSQLNNDQVVATVIYVGGTLTSRGAYSPLYQGAGIVINEASSIVADTFYLNAGALVDIRINCVVGNNLTVNSTAGLTYWSAHLVSAA